MPSIFNLRLFTIKPTGREYDIVKDDYGSYIVDIDGLRFQEDHDGNAGGDVVTFLIIGKTYKLVSAQDSFPILIRYD